MVARVTKESVELALTCSSFVFFQRVKFVKKHSNTVGPRCGHVFSSSVYLLSTRRRIAHADDSS